MITCAVIMSVYKNDKAEDVAQAVQSLLDQKISLMVNIYLAIDGPIPATLEKYINRHCHYFTRILKKPKNERVAKAMNDLIDLLGEEEYIFRMDADDIAMPDRFKRQVDFMEANPHVDVVGGGIIEFDDNGDEVTERYYPETDVEVRKYICKGNPLANVTTCFRRRVFDQGLRYPTDAFFDDITLVFDMLAKGFCVANIPYPMVRVRASGDYYKRRNIRWVIPEIKVYLRGIYKLHGLSWRMIFPFFRSAMRCLPTFATRIIYQSRAKFMNPSPSETHRRKAA